MIEDVDGFALASLPPWGLQCSAA